MLNEKIHKFYKQEKFYKVARDYPAELKKIIIQFFRSKGVNKFQQGYFSNKLDYDNLPSDPKEKKNKFKMATSSTMVRKDFFSAKEGGYDGKIDVVPFEYNDLDFAVQIFTNKEFFIDGHDLLISVDDSGATGSSGKKYYYKINLMRPVITVLEDVWENVEKSIEKFNSGKESELLGKKNVNRIKSNEPPDVRRLVDKYLQQWTKKRTLKSGEVKKTKYTDFDKLPIEFSVSIQSPQNNELSTFPRGEQTFTINFKIKAPKFKIKHLENFPKLTEYHEAYMSAMKKLGHSFGINRLEKHFSNFKVIDSSHVEMFNKLEFVIKKMSKHGYIPIKIQTSYKSSDPNSIVFGLSPKLKELAKNNPKEAEDKAMHKFGGSWESFREKFFEKTLNADDINLVLRSYIKKVLTSAPRK